MIARRNRMAEPEPLADILPMVPVHSGSRSAVCDCGAGYVQTQVGERWMPGTCQKCSADAHAAVRREEEQARQRKVRERLLDQLDVPLLYQHATLDNFTLHGNASDRQKQSRALQLARRYLAMWPERQDVERLEFPQVVVFRGCPGSGKGHVAWSIAQAVTTAHMERVEVVKLSDCIMELRQGWGQRRGDLPTERETLGTYRTAALLVIDEVSEHAFDGNPRRHLYDLVDYRQERLLPTILTSNETPAQLSALLGPALESRAAGWSGVWDFGESDYRVVRRHQRMNAKGGA